jgi:hypothetical protein
VYQVVPSASGLVLFAGGFTSHERCKLDGIIINY